MTVVRRIVLLALVGLLVQVAPVEAAPPPPPHWAQWELGPGVQHLKTIRPGLVANAARIEADAPMVLRPVVAFDRVGGGHAPYDGRQPTSELCRRVGGVACVNADFFNCPSCGQAAGGLVYGGRAIRSPKRGYPQISLRGDGELTTDPLTWTGTVEARVGDTTLDLTLASLNRGPARNGVVVYSPEWGPSTPNIPGQLEIVLSTGGPLVPGTVHATPVKRRGTSGGIPREGVVLAANGRAAAELDRFIDEWKRLPNAERSFVLETALSFPAHTSIGGRPILLQGGKRMQLDQRDGMVVRRHPRTLLGWTADGDVLLVTVDGRQPGYSNGVTLHTATSILLELGAVDGVNLDGGGSSTFAIRCPRGACVVNRPSDGRERPVPLALAVVPRR